MLLPPRTSMIDDATSFLFSQATCRTPEKGADPSDIDTQRPERCVRRPEAWKRHETATRGSQVVSILRDTMGRIVPLGMPSASIEARIPLPRDTHFKVPVPTSPPPGCLHN